MHKAINQPLSPERLFQYDSPCSEYTHPYQILALLKQQIPNIELKQESLSILEVGCATCGNLIPIARALKNSHCIGIDPFEEQIITAQKKIDQIGLKNITLYPIGIEDLEHHIAQDQKFDLVICHGIMSWIPAKAREILIEKCSDFLKDQGILYLSYNINPGWYLKRPARDLMRFHIKNITKTLAQKSFNTDIIQDQQYKLAHESKLILREFSEKSFTKSEINLKESYQYVYQQIISFPDYYLMHEYLLDDNEAYYLEEIDQKASRCGFSYVGDMSINTEFAYLALNHETQNYLKKNALSKVAFSQYIDFMFNFYIRRSIFIKNLASGLDRPKIDLNIDFIDHFNGFYLYTTYHLIDQQDQVMHFASYLTHKKNIVLKHHFLQAMFLLLSTQIGSIAFGSLIKLSILLDIEINGDRYDLKGMDIDHQAVEILKKQDFYPELNAELKKIILLECIETPMIQQICVAQEVSDYPQSLIELQSIDPQQQMISNAYHLVLNIDTASNQFLRLATGKNHKSNIYDEIGLVSPDQIIQFEQKILKIAVLVP